MLSSRVQNNSLMQSFQSSINKQFESDDDSQDQSFHSCEEEEETKEVHQQIQEAKNEMLSPFSSSYFRFHLPQQEQHQQQVDEEEGENEPKQQESIIIEQQKPQEEVVLEIELVDYKCKPKLQAAHNRLNQLQQQQKLLLQGQQFKPSPINYNLTLILLNLMARVKSILQTLLINNTLDLLLRISLYFFLLLSYLQRQNRDSSFPFIFVFPRLLYFASYTKLLLLKHDEKKQRFQTSLCNFIRKCVGAPRKDLIDDVDLDQSFRKKKDRNFHCKVILLIVIPAEMSILVMKRTGVQSQLCKNLQAYLINCWIYKSIEMTTFYPLVVLSTAEWFSGKFLLRCVYSCLIVDCVKCAFFIVILLKIGEKQKKETQLV